MSSSLYDEIDDSKSDNDMVLRPTSTTAAITQNSTNQVIKTILLIYSYNCSNSYKMQ